MPCIGALGDLVPLLTRMHCWSGGLMDTAPETQIHTGKMKAKFTYIGARWRRHQGSKWECKWEDSKGTVGMGIDGKCLEPQTALLAWTSFGGESPAPVCLKYVCHVWPLMTTRESVRWLPRGKQYKWRLRLNAEWEKPRRKSARISESQSEKTHRCIHH